MRKTDKKIDNTLRRLLTEVCDSALENVEGFKWLTHLVDYDNFPESLSVICIFNTNSELAQARSLKRDNYLRNLIKQKLDCADIKIHNITKHVSFDTEEECQIKNGGNWHQHLG